MAAFCLLYLLIQTAVPLVKLSEPRPSRFGWQMFTGLQERRRFSLVMRDGRNQPVDLRLYVAQSRGETELEEALPPHLCRVVPDVAAVLISTPGARQSRVYECR